MIHVRPFGSRSADDAGIPQKDPAFAEHVTLACAPLLPQKHGRRMPSRFRPSRVSERGCRERTASPASLDKDHHATAGGVNALIGIHGGKYRISKRHIEAVNEIAECGFW